MEWKELIEEKIYSDRRILSDQIANWKSFNEKIVFTNGCFDLLHLGHIDYLSKAADLGDRLVIGINTDSSVSRLKGDNRPVIGEVTRATKLAAMAFVDAVVYFDEETPIELISEVKPDILVKGGDYTLDQIVGANEVMKDGGKVEIISFLEGHSSSAIIEKVKKS
jgi:rfaE bifunctional protein nucleotidyltransferase chain/domain